MWAKESGGYVWELSNDDIKDNEAAGNQEIKEKEEKIEEPQVGTPVGEGEEEKIPSVEGAALPPSAKDGSGTGEEEKLPSAEDIGSDLLAIVDMDYEEKQDKEKKKSKGKSKKNSQGGR